MRDFVIGLCVVMSETFAWIKEKGKGRNREQRLPIWIR
jgi:hypothetical protein